MVKAPVIDLAEVGSGGGSIAWFDQETGTIRVGPQSAGASPGPACYGNAENATVTDANLILGFVPGDYFLGGEIGLDIEGARNAIQEKLAGPLGLDVLEAANGIVEIANAAMVIPITIRR